MAATQSNDAVKEVVFADGRIGVRGNTVIAGEAFRRNWRTHAETASRRQERQAWMIKPPSGPRIL